MEKVKTGKKKIEIDEDAKYAIRRTIQTFFMKNELPTLKKMMEVISTNEMILKMGKENFT